MDYNKLHVEEARWTRIKAKRAKILAFAFCICCITFWSMRRIRQTPVVRSVAAGSAFSLEKIHQINSDSSLRDQLSFHFPYEPEKPIGDKIWQTWKQPLSSTKFPKNFYKFQETWDAQNPYLNHVIIPDDAAVELIRNLFNGVPGVLDAYEKLPKAILKADFFRYLIVFARGGTYSDMDTVALKPIEQWASINSSAGLVIGIEADPDRADWNEWYARRIQFCQWTIQAKKGHPMLRELIVRIVEKTNDKQARGVLKKVEGKDSGGDIMNWTGPGIFTDTIFDYINYVFSKGATGDGVGIHNPNANAEIVKNDRQPISWPFFTGMESVKEIEDVMVLPITSFSPGVGQMGSRGEDDELAYVKHMFEGSWKGKQRG